MMACTLTLFACGGPKVDGLTGQRKAGNCGCQELLQRRSGMPGVMFSEALPAEVAAIRFPTRPDDRAHWDGRYRRAGRATLPNSEMAPLGAPRVGPAGPSLGPTAAAGTAEWTVEWRRPRSAVVACQQPSNMEIHRCDEKWMTRPWLVDFEMTGCKNLNRRSRDAQKPRPACPTWGIELGQVTLNFYKP